MSPTRSERPLARLCATFIPALLLLAWTATTVVAQRDSTLEYYNRLAKTSPRDAEAHFALSSWCSENGLEEQAHRLLERVIAIDPDHAGARAALGFRRHGLGWILGSGRTGPVTGNESPGSAPQPAAEPVEASEPPVDAPSGETTGGPEPSDTPAGTEVAKAGGSTKADIDKMLAERVETKRAFAKEAAEKLKMSFNTKEDADFMLHTTLELDSPQARELLAVLKEIKKGIQSVVGTKVKSPWPDKVQIFLFRAVAECIRFSEVIDGQRFPELDGYYTKDGHSVFFKVNEAHLGRLLGETCMDWAGSSDRLVNWWLRYGVGELIAAQTEDGREANLEPQAYQLVASTLDGALDAFHVADVIGTPGADGRRMGEGRARAFTLVDFLVRGSRSRFQKLVADLKSDEAPPPPADASDQAAFREYFVEYVAFQREALEKSYRMDLDELDAKWKKFILDRAKSLTPDQGQNTPGARGGRGPGAQGGQGGRPPGGGRGGGRGGAGGGGNRG